MFDGMLYKMLAWCNKMEDKMTVWCLLYRDSNLERVIKKMKLKSTKLNVLKAYRENSRYEKPSEKRVRKLKECIINTKIKKRKRENNL